MKIVRLHDGGVAQGKLFDAAGLYRDYAERTCKTPLIKR